MAESVNKVTIIDRAYDNSSKRDLMKVGLLKELFDDTAKKVKPFYKELVVESTTHDEYDRDKRMGGLLPASQLSESQNIPIQGPVLGGDKTYTQVRYGTGFRMSAWMDFFNKYDLYKRFSVSLRKVMEDSKDIQIHTMYNNPTATTYEWNTGFDTLALASAAHTGLLVNSTNDNYSNYPASSLSYSALSAMRYYYKTLKNDLGQLMIADPDLLVICPTLWTTATELLGSDKIPFELSNTDSAYKSWIKIYEDPRLTSTTMWFGLAKKDENFDFKVKTAKQPDFVVKDAGDTTRDKVVTSEMYYSFGFGSPKMLYLGNI
jgi:hypothetical protein